MPDAAWTSEAFAYRAPLAPELRTSDRMFAIPPLLGDELVAILVRLGCRVRQRRGGIVIVARGTRVVLVPDGIALGRHVVTAIVRTLGLDTNVFLAAVAKLPPPLRVCGAPRSRRAPNEDVSSRRGP